METEIPKKKKKRCDIVVGIFNAHWFGRINTMSGSSGGFTQAWFYSSRFETCQLCNRSWSSNTMR